MLFATTDEKSTLLHQLGAHCAAAALATYPSELIEPCPPGADQKLRNLINAVKLDVVTFYEAVPVQADISQVHDRWFLWLLREELKPHDKKGHCEAVAKLYERRLNGDPPTKKEWKDAAAAAATSLVADAAAYAAAANAAAAAAAYAADAAAADADAAYAAAAAAYAAYAAAAAAYAAADAAAWNQREECYQRMRDVLLRLVWESPP